MNKFKIIVLLFFFFALGTFLGGTVKYFNIRWVADRNINEYLSFFEPQNIDDNYGGSTPEETFDMYLDALRKGDLELASKYYTVDKWDKRLEVLKNTDINSYIKELEGIMLNWISYNSIGNISTFIYKEKIDKDTNIDFLGTNIDLPAGEYTRKIEFEKINNIWKISLL